MARTAYRRVFQGCSGRRFEDRVRQYSGRVHAGDTKQWNRLCAASGASLLFLCGNDECAPSRGFLLPGRDHTDWDQSSWAVSKRIRRRRKASGNAEPTNLLLSRAIWSSSSKRTECSEVSLRRTVPTSKRSSCAPSCLLLGRAALKAQAP